MATHDSVPERNLTTFSDCPVASSSMYKTSTTCALVPKQCPGVVAYHAGHQPNPHRMLHLCRVHAWIPATLIKTHHFYVEFATEDGQIHRRWTHHASRLAEFEHNLNSKKPGHLFTTSSGEELMLAPAGERGGPVVALSKQPITLCRTVLEEADHDPELLICLLEQTVQYALEHPEELTHL